MKKLILCLVFSGIIYAMHDGQQSHDICIICRTALAADATTDSLSLPFACHHPNYRYHRDCMTQWMYSCITSNTAVRCPLCNTGIRHHLSLHLSPPLPTSWSSWVTHQLTTLQTLYRQVPTRILELFVAAGLMSLVGTALTSLHPR